LRNSVSVRYVSNLVLSNVDFCAITCSYVSTASNDVEDEGDSDGDEVGDVDAGDEEFGEGDGLRRAPGGAVCRFIRFALIRLKTDNASGTSPDAVKDEAETEGVSGEGEEETGGAVTGIAADVVLVKVVGEVEDDEGKGDVVVVLTVAGFDVKEEDDFS